MTDRFAKLGVGAYFQKAQTVADGILDLGEQLPGFGREIRTVGAKLYELKALLQAFDLQTQEPNINRLSHENASRACKDVHKCLNTLNALENVFNGAEKLQQTSLDKSPEKLWRDILNAFMQFEHEDILSRLDAHKKVLDETICMLKK